jgi:hypothetical protein
MRLPSMGGRVRPATSIDGVTFEQAWKPLGKAEFIAKKKAAGRPQDLADVAYLESMNAG